MNVIRILMLGESLNRKGGIASVQRLILENTSPKLKITHITTLPNSSFFFIKVLIFFYSILQLCWIVAVQNIDLIHIHVSERGSAYRHSIISFLCRIMKKPLIIHAHGADFISFYSNLSYFGKNWFRWSFGYCSSFIVLSDSWKKYYVENLNLCDEKVHVFYNPVKLPSQVPTRKEENKISFLSLGNIGKRKGAFDLIKAFSELPLASLSKARLVLAGDGNLNKARELVNESRMTNNIEVLAWVNEVEKELLFNEADVFVLPSYNEGLPMSILEAMSRGLPIISTPVGGIPEIVINEKNGLIVSPGNVKELSLAIEKLIDDSKFRLSLGDASRKSSLQFDIKEYSIRLTNHYIEILNK